MPVNGLLQVLSERERLVLLALALKLMRASGNVARSLDVMELSGLDEEDFDKAVRALLFKGFVRSEDWVTLKLAGDAVTLMGERRLLRTDPH